MQVSFNLKRVILDFQFTFSYNFMTQQLFFYLNDSKCCALEPQNAKKQLRISEMQYIW